MSALTYLLILEIVIAFSFIITSIFMFVPKKNESVHKIFFALAIALGFLVTFVTATSFPSNSLPQIILSWAALIPSAVAMIIAAAKGKPTVPAKLLVMLTTVYACFCYFML